MTKSTALLSALLLAALPASGCIVESAQAQPGPGGEAAPAIPASGAPAPQTLSWPRVYQEGAVTLTLYQPQIEQWDDTTMTFRAAIALQSEAGVQPAYGILRTTARAEVDKAAGLVTLSDFQIVKVNFPTAPGENDSARETLLHHLPAAAKTISLDRLEASLAVSQAVKKQRELGVNNNPPRIIFSSTPALLALVDGDPVLRPFMSALGAERVVNTQALILKAGGAFYLTALNYWYVAAAVEGPWTPVDNPSATLDEFKQAASATNLVDLMQPEVGASLPATPPAMYVSTVPAELIETDGPPQMIPIEGTGLYQAQNSDDPIFMDGNSGLFYVLISGRWFRSPSLQAGPWKFVPAGSLPPDFAKIPQDNPRANVLVSVPGTPEDREALIANSIPQTATVTCGPGDVDLDYDGAPQFEPIQGTDLSYALNATPPVIQCAPDSYYCVQNGIWFFAPTPTGPWTVATVVPPEIYGIPVSCPVYYVTYVRIYGWTGDTVCEGYTPGYLGTVVSEDGVVVFGTGYYHRCHIGAEWHGFPCTYGLDAGFACGPDTSFAFGFAAGLFGGGRCHPWWGPYRWGWRHDVNYNHISLNHVNLYENWHGGAVSIPRRGEAVRAEEKGRVREPKQFHPYSARPVAPVREVSAATRPNALPAIPSPAPKPAARDWSANAKPRPLPVAPMTIPTEGPAAPRPSPALHPPVSEHEATAKPQPTPIVQPARAVAAPREAQIPLQNNVFVGENGEVYRRTLAPPAAIAASKPRPASEPIVLPPASRAPQYIAPPAEPGLAPHAPQYIAPPAEPGLAPHAPQYIAPPAEPGLAPRAPQYIAPPAEPGLAPRAPAARPPVRAPEPAPQRLQPSQPAQWEQRTKNGWQPAAQSPSFQREAPQLNREAAARDLGEVRASSAPNFAPPAFNAPIMPTVRPTPIAPPAFKAPPMPSFSAPPGQPPMGGPPGGGGRGR